MRRKFDVTQEKIDRGVRCSSGLCPVALAIKEQLPGKEVLVDPWTISIFPDNTDLPTPMQFFDSSEEVRKFVNAFDSGKEVSPFSFELEVVE